MSAGDVRATALALATQLLERLRDPEVRELEVRDAGVRVKVSRDGAAAVAAATPTAVREGPSATLEHAVRPPAAPAAPAKAVTAPLTGLFYRGPSAQAPAFVQVGTVVAVGDVIGLIEAMKLFNEVRSTVAGRVRRIVAENGQLVRAHQALLELE